MMNILRYFLTPVLLCILAACSETPKPPEQKVEPTITTNTSAQLNLDKANEDFLNSLRSEAEAALKTALTLQATVNQFLLSPAPNVLSEAQNKWQSTEAALQRLYPLVLLTQSNPESFDQIRRILYNVQAHPIQPGYLDRFGPYAYSGLVYDVGFALTAHSLRQQHGLTDEEEAVLGIYAIEFMLFGTKGNRAVTDYTQFTSLNEEHLKSGLKETSEIPENRRRKLIALQCAQLVSDLNALSENLSSRTGIAPWLALDSNSKLTAVRRSINAALTQFLIDLAGYQKQISEAQNETLPNPAPADGKTHAAPKLTKMHLKLNTLETMTGFLGELEQEATVNAITAASQTLESEISRETPDPDATKAALQSIYEQIKILL